MKRFLSLTLVAIMLLSTIMLTSCDVVIPASNFVHNLFGITRHTITEKEWNNAFDITNYTAVMTNSTQKLTISLDYPYAKYETVFLSNPNKSNIIYINLQTGALCGEENGEWIETTEKAFIVEKEKVSIKSDINTDKIDFADLVYDEETKSYTYNKRMEADLIFKFENGALVSIETIMKADLYNTKQIVSDFGSTVVEWPI